MAFGCGGCAMSGSGSFAVLDSVRDAHAAMPVQAEKAAAPSDSDLALARAAASDVLAGGAKDSSQPWENPATGARGAVTPIADAYTAEGRTCRDFLASFVKDSSENWLHGAACRSERGGWSVQSMKPWKRA